MAFLETTMCYSLKDDGELTIHYSAISDEACPFNITNHAFFNLNSTGSIEDHVLILPSNHYIDVNSELIPHRDKRNKINRF